MKATAQVLRQGDVLLIPMTQPPSANARALSHLVLAEGEMTGHSHQVIAPVVTDPDPVPPCQLFEEPDGTRILVLTRPAELRHQEHDPITLTGSTYEIRRQSEWSLDDVRQVAD